MDSLQKLIQAIASLLWPLIVVAVLFIFRPAIIALIESAKSRKFTLKIGGQELSMEEANQQQQNLIADLQTQVSNIQRRLDRPTATSTPFSELLGALPIPPLAAPQLNAPTASSPQARPATVPKAQEAAPSEPTKISAILWVDDNPKNNSYFVEQLAKAEVKVDLAKSTAEAMTLFNSHKYDYVISDMGRTEGLLFRKTAGLDLLKDIRAISTKIPFVFFTSPEAIDSYGQQATESGATAMTSSATKLMGMLNLATAGNLG
ncbi:response regulator [Granulicella arctica]|uniref:response regulator n=1 Tax=Granulicella arctica TaxID=940613 RepID=UPI0021DFE0FC|nr:response regulator [Granulicella arctica]